jgi:hypothetical protein
MSQVSSYTRAPLQAGLQTQPTARKRTTYTIINYGHGISWVSNSNASLPEACSCGRKSLEWLWGEFAVAEI